MSRCSCDSVFGSRFSAETYTHDTKFMSAGCSICSHATTVVTARRGPIFNKRETTDKARLDDDPSSTSTHVGASLLLL